jgi:hypothetical protein
MRRATARAAADLAARSKAKIVEQNRWMQEGILLARCREGDAVHRQFITRLLTFDGVPADEAAAGSGRIHAGLHPDDGGGDRVLGAFLWLGLRKAGLTDQAAAADAAKREKEEEEAHKAAILASVALGADETGRDHITQPLEELAQEWNRRRMARLQRGAAPGAAP